MKHKPLLTQIGLLSSLALPFIALRALKTIRRNHHQPLQSSHPGKTSHVSLSTSSQRFSNTWIVFNPSKTSDSAAFKDQISRYMAQKGIQKIHWIETTPQDPGTQQTVRALHEGASLVIAAGGDGTVRATCAALAHSGIPLGVIPIGTGNILARNLKIPLGNVNAALDIITQSHATLLDLAWLRTLGTNRASMTTPEGTLLDEAYSSLGITPHPRPHPVSRHEHSFVAISGAGFDGETMAHTDASFKQKVGWWAYVFSAMKAMWIKRTHVHLRLHSSDKSFPLPLVNDSASQEVRQRRSVNAASRCVLFANCGQLPVLSLVPSAHPADGLIDVVTVNTRAGIMGWTLLMIKIFAQGFGMNFPYRPSSLATMSFTQAPSTTAFFASPQPVQVDGDAIGSSRIVHVRVDHNALLITAPNE